METIKEYFKPVEDLTPYQTYLIEKTFKYQINKIKEDIEEIRKLKLISNLENFLIRKYEDKIKSIENDINELLSFEMPIDKIDFNKNLRDNEIDILLKSKFNLDETINANLNDFELVIESAKKYPNSYPINIINEINSFKGKIKFNSFIFSGFIEELPQILYDVFKINLSIGENKHFLNTRFEKITVYETKEDFPIKHLVFFISKGNNKILIFDGFNYINYYHPNTVTTL